MYSSSCLLLFCWQQFADVEGVTHIHPLTPRHTPPTPPSTLRLVLVEGIRLTPPLMSTPRYNTLLPGQTPLPPCISPIPLGIPLVLDKSLLSPSILTSTPRVALTDLAQLGLSVDLANSFCCSSCRASHYELSDVTEQRKEPLLRVKQHLELQLFNIGKPASSPAAGPALPMGVVWLETKLRPQLHLRVLPHP